MRNQSNWLLFLTMLVIGMIGLLYGIYIGTSLEPSEVTYRHEVKLEDAPMDSTAITVKSVMLPGDDVGVALKHLIEKVYDLESRIIAVEVRSATK